jgi:hypothetical protein
MISNSILSDAALDVATASRGELHTPLYLYSPKASIASATAILDVDISCITHAS